MEIPYQKDWKLPKKKVGFGAAVNFSALGIEFPKKYDESKKIQSFVSGDLDIGNGSIETTASNEGIGITANVSTAELSSTILDLHGRDTGFRVKVNLSVLTAGAEAKITMADGVSFKLGAGIIGAGFSAKTYDVIDERLRF